jgi:hypothetical protein
VWTIVAKTGMLETGNLSVKPPMRRTETVDRSTVMTRSRSVCRKWMIFRPDVRKQVQKWIGIGGDTLEPKERDYKGEEDESQLKYAKNIMFLLIVKNLGIF